MPVILLLLGVVTAAAGLLLVASGAPIRDGAFDAEVVTPGTIAAVGGLLLIGMGLAVRELQRIERALAVRPTQLPRGGGVAAEGAAASVSIPFPPKPKASPQPASASATPASGPSEDATVERPQMKLSVVEGADISPLSQAPARGGEDVSEEKGVAAAGYGAGAAASARVPPRLDAKARPAAAPGKAKSSVFNAFWPAAPRRDAQTAAVHVAAPPSSPAIEPRLSDEAVSGPRPVAEDYMAAAPVSVLKSGVVEGMAYTLYSDGSIEAQLPQGTMRFGSIAALREHIERSP